MHCRPSGKATVSPASVVSDVVSPGTIRQVDREPMTA
jgi:hypothetical protein